MTRSEKLGYDAIASSLRSRMTVGEWTVGSLLPRMRDLAIEYGVSLGTVQRAVHLLSGEGLILSHGKRGIGVIGLPKQYAATESSTAPVTVGIIGANEAYDAAPYALARFWMPVVTSALERAVTALGGRSQFFNVYYHTPNHFSSIEHALDAALASNITALAVVNIHEYGGWEDALATRLSEIPMPLLYLSTCQAALNCANLGYDQQAAGYHAAAHLIESGYRSIHFLIPFDSSWVNARFHGAAQAVQHARIPNVSIVRCAEPHPYTKTAYYNLATADRVRCLESLLTSALDDSEYPLAIIVPSDHEALLLNPLLSARGLRPGIDIGVIGFDDLADARLVGLSSMRPPLEALGDTAGRFLVRAVHGETLPYRTLLQSQLVARTSTEFAG